MAIDISSVRISDPSDVRRAAVAFRDTVAEVSGMKVAACHNIALNDPMVDGSNVVLASAVFGWTGSNLQWWKKGQIALDSPIPTVCRYESEPFWINDLGIFTRQKNPFTKSVDLVNFATRSMTHAAIVVPIHLPFGQIGAVSFNPTDTKINDLTELFEKHADQFDMLSRAFIISYVRHMCRVQRLPLCSKLTKREVQCLRWAAIGKTDYEISVIMARSRATVRFHLHNASVKLDAVNRSQTVFKATQLGFIGLNS